MKYLNFLKVWIPLAIVVTALCLLIYTALQQDLRLGGNDPQIQMAEDEAAALNSGKTSIQTLPVSNTLDISQSLSPFVIIYDSSGKILNSSVTLDSQTPQVPDGVFRDAQNKELRFTWQPKSGVRIAAVVSKYNGGFVLAGRNLREVENRINQLSLMVGVAWVGTLAVTFIVTFMGFNLFSKRN